MNEILKTSSKGRAMYPVSVNPPICLPLFLFFAVVLVSEQRRPRPQEAAGQRPERLPSRVLRLTPSVRGL